MTYFKKCDIISSVNDRVIVNKEEAKDGLRRISDYLEDVKNLSEDIIRDVNEIQKIGRPWVSKLSTEKIQKRMGLDSKQRGI